MKKNILKDKSHKAANNSENKLNEKNFRIVFRQHETEGPKKSFSFPFSFFFMFFTSKLVKRNS